MMGFDFQPEQMLGGGAPEFGQRASQLCEQIAPPAPQLDLGSPLVQTTTHNTLQLAMDLPASGGLAMNIFLASPDEPGYWELAYAEILNRQVEYLRRTLASFENLPPYMRQAMLDRLSEVPLVMTAVPGTLAPAAPGHAAANAAPPNGYGHLAPPAAAAAAEAMPHEFDMTARLTVAAEQNRVARDGHKSQPEAPSLAVRSRSDEVPADVVVMLELELSPFVSAVFGPHHPPAMTFELRSRQGQRVRLGDGQAPVLVFLRPDLVQMPQLVVSSAVLNSMINDLFAPQGHIDGNEPTGDLLVNIELPQVLAAAAGSPRVTFAMPLTVYKNVAYHKRIKNGIFNSSQDSLLNLPMARIVADDP